MWFKYEHFYLEENIENFKDYVLLQDFVYRKMFKGKIEKVINRRNNDWNLKEKATIWIRDI